MPLRPTRRLPALLPRHLARSLVLPLAIGLATLQGPARAAGEAAAAPVPAHAITGAGSTAAAPVYRTWATEYAKAASMPLVYEAVGSSAGMARIGKHEVDFGASDVIAPAADLKKADLVMFPTVVTGVVPVVNLPKGAPSPLKLTGEVLAHLFLGDIKSWDAPEIAALNPGARLPALPVRLVVRADGSGTTWHFAEYLSAVSADWKRTRGVASRYDWPATSTVLAVKGSDAVADAVKATPGALGYIDFNYVLDDHLDGVALRNADGQFVTAGVEGFRDAVTHSAWAAEGDFAQGLANRPGKGTWPVTMGTYVAMPRVAPQKDRAERALRFVIWSYLHGDQLARQAKFVPLPERVQASAYREISRITDAGGEAMGLRLMSTLVR